MGLAFSVWAHQKLTGRPYSLPPLNTPYESFAQMSTQTRQLLDQVRRPPPPFVFSFVIAVDMAR